MNSVFLFPGQGSQRVGMVQDFLDAYPDQTRNLFDLANQVTGINLLRLALLGPEEELNLTYNTQPALLTLSVLVFQLLNERYHFQPSVMAGHSLGEYSALVCAGCLEFADAVHLVRKRGEIMQNSVPAGTGTMIAIIGLPLHQLDSMIKELSSFGKIEVANYNSSDQVVLSLERHFVKQVNERAKAWGAKKIIELRVSAPFHSSFMKEAAEEFKPILSEVPFHKPRIRYLSNVTADYVDHPEQIRKLLAEQMVSPVRWKEIMDRLYQEGYRYFAEIGPGKVLSRLFKRDYESVQVIAIDSANSLNQFVKEADAND